MKTTLIAALCCAASLFLSCARAQQNEAYRQALAGATARGDTRVRSAAAGQAARPAATPKPGAGGSSTKTRAVKGHGFGLDLTADEREARIAFRKAL